MNPVDRLVRLDAAVLPRLARGLVRLRNGTRRIRIRPLSAVATVLVVAVAMTALWRLGEPHTGGAGTGPFFRVGVEAGASIPQYVASSDAELSRLAGALAADPVVALVTFSAYLDPDQVTQLAALAGPQLSTVAAFARVPLPRQQTERVRLAAQRLPDDLVASMMTIADRKESEATTSTEIAGRAPSVVKRQTAERSAAVSAAEAAAYRNGHCACVFALVVRGAPRVLTRLRALRGVRVVDPAPEVTRLENTSFTPPFPEQITRAEPLPDDAVAPSMTTTPRPSLTH